MRKSESAVNRCKTISTVQKLLGGKYKIELLWYIGKCNVRRFGQLRRQIGEITESSLTKQLRELETNDGTHRNYSGYCGFPAAVHVDADTGKRNGCFHQSWSIKRKPVFAGNDGKPDPFCTIGFGSDCDLRIVCSEAYGQPFFNR